MSKSKRSTFGSVRKLPSGRWQARYPDEAGRPMKAPRTFPSEKAARAYLAEVQTDRARGAYIDHREGGQLFGPYARAWIASGGTRGKLAPRTAELYSDIVARQLATFDAMPLNAIKPQTVRDWYSATRRTLAAASKARGGNGEARLRQSYSLLRGIMGTAVRDRIIASNPCTIVGAGSVQSPERPHLTPEQLSLIVGKMPKWYAAPMRLALAAHLRLGELAALQRGDFDAEQMTLRIERQTIVVGGELVTTETKTGVSHTVALPPSAAAMLAEHLAGSVGFARSPMFTRPDGQAISRVGIQRAWQKAAKSLGLAGYHLHDIRHTGLTLAAQSGATTRELMARGGHRSPSSSHIYQHAAAERMAMIAERLDGLILGQISGTAGTQMARSELPGADTAMPDQGEIPA